jgi:DNA-binding NarL/FixJ family response regulator
MHVLLADDHPLYAEALQGLIERSIPDSRLLVVTDLAAAHAALGGEQKFDLAILDLHMPGSDGFAGIERTLRRFAETPILVISGAATPAEVARAIALGAKGFLPKNLPSNVVSAAIQLVASGGTYLPAEYGQRAARSPGGRSDAPSSLTPREAEVLEILRRGQSNKEIGRALGLQEITVKLHVRNLFRKLGVRNRVEAANSAAAFERSGEAPE